MQGVILSKRLQMLGNMVTAGSRAVDVGCDHAFLSIWLVQTGVSPRAIAMDVRKGPLAAAKEHIRAHGLEGYIETRLSDGLQGCGPEEADTLICAGMGGRLMERIIREGMETARGFAELILQPQSELGEFRAFLRREGFAVEREEAVCEDGKYYFAMRAVPGKPPLRDIAADTSDGGGNVSQEQRVCDRFGERLILKADPVLREFLYGRRENLRRLSETLRAGDSRRQQERFAEVFQELSDVEYALERMRDRGGFEVT